MAETFNLDTLEELLESMEPEEIRSQYRAELAANPTCEAMLENFEAMDQHLAQLKASTPAPPPLMEATTQTNTPPPQRENVYTMPGLQVPKQPKRARWFRLQFALPLAAILVVALILGTRMQTSNPLVLKEASAGVAEHAIDGAGELDDVEVSQSARMAEREASGESELLPPVAAPAKSAAQEAPSEEPPRARKKTSEKKKATGKDEARQQAFSASVPQSADEITPQKIEEALPQETTDDAMALSKSQVAQAPTQYAVKRAKADDAGTSAPSNELKTGEEMMESAVGKNRFSDEAAGAASEFKSDMAANVAETYGFGAPKEDPQIRNWLDRYNKRPMGTIFSNPEMFTSNARLVLPFSDRVDSRESLPRLTLVGTNGAQYLLKWSEGKRAGYLVLELNQQGVALALTEAYPIKKG